MFWDGVSLPSVAWIGGDAQLLPGVASGKQ